MSAGSELLGIASLQILGVLMMPFGAAAWLVRRGIPSPLSISAGLIAAPIMAMAVFWLTWVTLPARWPGVLAGWIALVLGAALAGIAVAKGQWRDEVAHPFLITVCATCVLLAWTYLGHLEGGGLLNIAAARWTHELPGDNQIPLDFAKALFTGRIPTPLYANWLSSDRPPLQTALYLTTPDWLICGPRELGYQPAAVAMQMMVLLGGWSLMRALGVGHRLANAGSGAAFLTPLVIVNGAYVWPKLMPAGLLLAAAAIHLTSRYESVKDSFRWGTILGALSGLAMLAHGGSVFAIGGSAMAALLGLRLGSSRYFLGALLAAMVLYAPWIAYQKFVDPPGDGLAKMHLAGVSNVDPRPLTEAVVASYHEVTLAQVLERRERDFSVLFAHVGRTYARTLRAAKEVVVGATGPAREILASIREDQFYGFAAGSGLLGLGLYLLPLGLFNRNVRRLALAVTMTLMIWIAVMFEPGSTFIHQGTLFPEIAIIVCVLAVISPHPRLSISLIGLHAAITGFQYAL